MTASNEYDERTCNLEDDFKSSFDGTTPGTEITNKLEAKNES